MTGPKHAIALFSALAVALALAATAGAADGAPTDDPVIKEQPNLAISSASVVPYGTSEWEIRYTVANRGGLATPSFRVAVQQNGSTFIKDAYHSSLAPGASRSGTIHISRAGCYIRCVCWPTRPNSSPSRTSTTTGDGPSASRTRRARRSRATG